MSYLNTFANLITLAKTNNASAGFVLGLFHFVRNVTYKNILRVTDSFYILYIDYKSFISE